MPSDSTRVLSGTNPETLIRAVRKYRRSGQVNHNRGSTFETTTVSLYYTRIHYYYYIQQLTSRHSDVDTHLGANMAAPTREADAHEALSALKGQYRVTGFSVGPCGTCSVRGPSSLRPPPATLKSAVSRPIQRWNPNSTWCHSRGWSVIGSD